MDGCCSNFLKFLSYRGLFTAGWFGVREKHCFRLEIYDRLRASEQAEELCQACMDKEEDYNTTNHVLIKKTTTPQTHTTTITKET